VLVPKVGCKRLCADAALVCQLTGTVIGARGEGMLLGRDVCVCAGAGACVEVNGEQTE
jgi:hypothetical protein